MIICSSFEASFILILLCFEFAYSCASFSISMQCFKRSTVFFFVKIVTRYGQERVILNKLIGDTHISGDLQDIGPPRVKLWLNPKDNDHITYVKTDPRYTLKPGLSESDVSFHKILSQILTSTPSSLLNLKYFRLDLLNGCLRFLGLYSRWLLCLIYFMAARTPCMRPF